MPSLNVTFTDEEMTTVRQVAEMENKSLKAVVHDAALKQAHKDRVLAEAIRVAQVSSNLNKRLAEQ